VNGNIMAGFGIALGVWGGVASVPYGQVAIGASLLVVGIALVVAGSRHPKRGQ